MNQAPKAWKRCIVRFEGRWFSSWWTEDSPLVTLVKTTPMPGEGFAPQEHEPAKSRGYMFRRVPACEVEAFPVILYKGEGAGLGEMDPASDTFRVTLDSGFCTVVGTTTAARLDGWAVVSEWDRTIVSPYLDPEDPRIELVPGLPFPPGVQPAPKASATWPPRPPGAAPRRLRFVAQHRGAWYIALWNEAEAEATLLKSARMPGEGFTPVQGEPARSQGVMERRVPAAEVQAYMTLTFMAEKVHLGRLDPDADSLQVSLFQSAMTDWGQRSSGAMQHWQSVEGLKDTVESPFMAPSDRRIYAVAGLPLVS